MPHEEQKREEVSKCCGAKRAPFYGGKTHLNNECDKCGGPFIPHTEEKCNCRNPERHKDYPDGKCPVAKFPSPKTDKRLEPCTCSKDNCKHFPKTDKGWEERCDIYTKHDLWEIFGIEHGYRPEGLERLQELVREIVRQEKSLSYAEGEKNNLAKLIEECGNGFNSLVHDHSSKIGWFWTATSVDGLAEGNTPQEAVKNLLAALKEKKV